MTTTFKQELASGDRVPVQSPTLEGAILLVSEPGEHILVLAESDQLVGRDLFERRIVALTDHRVLLFSADPGHGYMLNVGEQRSACTVINYKTLADGSMLLILGWRGTYKCLYFKSASRPQADAILMGLSPDVNERPEIDRFALSQEFAGLCVFGEEEDYYS